MILNSYMFYLIHDKVKVFNGKRTFQEDTPSYNQCKWMFLFTSQPVFSMKTQLEKKYNFCISYFFNTFSNIIILRY